MRVVRAFFVVGLWSLSATVMAEKAVVVDQPTSPLKIQSYVATYQTEGRYSREGVSHKVTLLNTSDQMVVAYRIAFNAFDAFNESMGRGLGGISIEEVAPGATAEGTWVQSPYAAFAFKKYGTGVAYVRTVRLADGSVWMFNETEVLKELQKISEDLTADIFEDKGGTN